MSGHDRPEQAVTFKRNGRSRWAGICNISQTDLQILRIKQVIELTGLARATVYKYIHEREFPLPVSLVGASVGWLRAEIEYWLACCAEESSDESLDEPEAQSEAA